MSKPLLPDVLWAIVAPLLPPESPKPGPGLFDRHPLRAQERHPVGISAGRDGLRLGRRLLTPPARPAAGRRLGSLAPDSPRPPGRRRPHRLGAGSLDSASAPAKRGRRGRTEPERSRKARRQVEHTLAWPNRYRRLTIRYERRVAIHQALPTLGCALICFNHLPPPDGL